MTTEETKRFMAHFIEEFINRQNIAATDQLVALDFFEQVPFPG